MFMELVQPPRLHNYSGMCIHVYFYIVYPLGYITIDSNYIVLC